ncbi:MAG: nuclear transport factor 2 family protein [Saprospiraceae bacterium]|nr:nuclear transport factor 2 family protein [Saprospiraceae bacterium]
MKFQLTMLLITLTCSSLTGFSQQPGELYDEIAKVDSLLFSVAQKDCDLETYESFLSEDFEYFHDTGGFTESKDKEMEDMGIFCGKEQRSRQPLRRELIKSTLQVYPMDNYGHWNSATIFSIYKLTMELKS